MTKLCACGCGGKISAIAKEYIRGHNWLATRFRRFKVERRGYRSACWIWEGCEQRSGYCRVWHDGRSRMVHRVFYEKFVGPIPEGLTIDHLCKVRRCCNPKHLEAVTLSENSKRSHADRAPGLIHNRGKYWVEGEVSRLRQLIGAGLTDREICRVLNRTRLSVAAARRSLGLKRPAPHSRKVLAEEEMDK